MEGRVQLQANPGAAGLLLNDADQLLQLRQQIRWPQQGFQPVNHRWGLPAQLQQLKQLPPLWLGQVQRGEGHAVESADVAAHRAAQRWLHRFQQHR